MHLAGAHLEVDRVERERSRRSAWSAAVTSKQRAATRLSSDHAADRTAEVTRLSREPLATLRDDCGLRIVGQICRGQLFTPQSAR